MSASDNGIRHFRYNGESLRLVASKYEYNGNLALLVYGADGKPVCDMSINISPLPDPKFALDAGRVDPGLVQALCDAHGITPTGETLKSGFRKYPVYLYRW